MKLEHVVVALDLERRGKDALRVGAAVAGRLGAELTVLHIDPQTGGVSASGRVARLAKLIEATLGADHAARIELRINLFPVDGMLDFLRARRGDLACVGGLRRSGRFGAFGRPDSTLALLRECPIPVLVVPGSGS